LPGGVLFEGELRVKGLEDGEVREFKVGGRGVAGWPEGSRGHIGHVVSAALDRDGDEGRGFVHIDAHHEGSDQTMADPGAAGRHATSPANSGGVVAPGGDMLVLERDEMFEDEVLKEEAGHLQIVDG
jgi:hypothetical protein